MKASPTALFSLYDTTMADSFAESLIRSGWNIIGSTETVELLREKALPVQDIAEFTGNSEDFDFPPTLHPKVESALTLDGASRIDLVYVIPYPRSQGNDVGGRTLLSLAVKGRRIPVMSVVDMEKVVSSITKSGQIPEEMHLNLLDKVCYEVANHYACFLSNRECFDYIAGQFSYGLMNGENPYQIPASVFQTSGDDDKLSLLKFKKITGDPPCFTNMADADCILQTLSLAVAAFTLNCGTEPYICIAAKHGNPCGMGVSESDPAEAVEKALWGNPRSIWGGEVITNFQIDEAIARKLKSSEKREELFGNRYWMLDIILASTFTSPAIEILGAGSRRKLFANDALKSPFLKVDGVQYRQVRGGFLRQPSGSYVLDLRACQGDLSKLSESEIYALLIAWAVAFSSNCGGNEIALVKDGALLGVGGGPSTYDAVQVAIARAKECEHNLYGAVFAADAFFPFADAPALLCDAGVTVGCVPQGGKGAADIIELFVEKNTRVIFLPEACRGFCRH